MQRETTDYKKFMSDDLIDFLGNRIEVGDIMLKPDRFGSSPVLVRCKVTSIKDNKVYLDYSKIAIKFPSRCVKISSCGVKCEK
jgi:hypothetical protein